MNVTERKYTPRAERVSSLPKLGSSTTRAETRAQPRDRRYPANGIYYASTVPDSLCLSLSSFPLSSALSFSPSLFPALSVKASSRARRSKTSCCERHVTTTASLCLAHYRRKTVGRSQVEAGQSGAHRIYLRTAFCVAPAQDMPRSYTL